MTGTAVAQEPTPVRRDRRSLGIDVAKGLAILGVIAQHVVDPAAKLGLGGPLWFEQAVPVFVLLMAFNAAGGFARSGARSLGDLYSRAYWVSRWRRLVLPIVPVWLVLILVGAAQDRLVLGPLQLVGAAPIAGGAPGDYFVALVIALALLLPGAWWCWVRAPGATAAGLVAVTVVVELLGRPLLLGTPATQYVAIADPLRFGATIAVGFWLAGRPDLPTVLRERRLPLALAAAASLAYLLAVTLVDGGRTGFGVLFPGFTTSTGLWALGWTTLLALVIVTAVDRWRTAALRPLAELGKASYHVFLVQLAVIGLWRTDAVGLLVVEVVASLAVGWLFWRLTERRRVRVA